MMQYFTLCFIYFVLQLVYYMALTQEANKHDRFSLSFTIIWAMADKFIPTKVTLKRD